MPKEIRGDPFLLCRRGASGHDWDHITVSRKTEWGYPVSFRCTRCTAERHDVYDINGDLSYRSYEYPSNYKLEEPATSADVRRELIRRFRRTA